MCRQVHRELTRNELRDLTTIVPASACQQRNYVGAYSRFMSVLFIAAYCERVGGAWPYELSLVLVAAPYGCLLRN